MLRDKIEIGEWTQIWRKAAKNLNFSLEQVVPQTLELGCDHDLGWRRQASLVWISRSQLNAGLLEIHKRAETHSSVFEAVNVGEGQFLEYMSDIFLQPDCEEDCIHLLTLASTRVVDLPSSRRLISALRDLLNKQTQFRWTWHHRSRHVVPGDLFSFEDVSAEMGTYEIHRCLTVDELAKIIVRGHKRLFEKFAFVRPHYLETPPKSIQKGLDAWHAEVRQQRLVAMAASQRQLIENKAECERIAKARAINRQKLLAPNDRERTFPRRQWSTITREELAQALSEYPVTHLAVMYEVSDTMIRKKMRKWQLKGKPQGFWLRSARARAMGAL